MSEQTVRTLPEFEAAIAAWPRILLFKHSPVCPISAAARAEYEVFRLDHPDVPTLFVDVIAARATARGIAGLCGIRHESPQAILFENGRPVWHASHDAITAGSLTAAWAPRC